ASGFGRHHIGQDSIPVEFRPSIYGSRNANGRRTRSDECTTGITILGNESGHALLSTFLRTAYRLSNWGIGGSSRKPYWTLGWSAKRRCKKRKGRDDSFEFLRGPLCKK